MRKLLVGLALSLVATAAAAEWVLVSHTKYGEDRYYADPTTKRRTGNIVRMWTLQDYLKPEVAVGVNKVFYSVLVYRQFDCVEETVQIRQTNVYTGQMASGEMIVAENEPLRKISPAPGSHNIRLFNFACK